MYKALGRHDEALELQLEALKTRQRELGEEHRDAATSKSNLAATYHALGRDGEALELQLEVLEFNQLARAWGGAPIHRRQQGQSGSDVW